MVSNSADEGGEGKDRKSIGLAADQARLAAAVLAAVHSKNNGNADTNNKKDGGAGGTMSAALVLINGAIIALDDALNDAAPAVLDTFMPGPYGGEAFAATVWGENVPGGKMPSTVYYR